MEKSLRFGFCTYYRSGCQATIHSLRLANLVFKRGHDVSIWSSSDKHETIDPDWDHGVHYRDMLPYQEWVADCDVLIWTTIPSPELIECAAEAKCYNVLMLDWHQLSPQLQASCAMVDKIVVPCVQSRDLIIENWKLNDIAVIPWDPGIPSTRSEVKQEPDRVRLCWRMEGDWVKHIGGGAVVAMRQLAEDLPTLDQTVVIHNAWASRETLRWLRRFARELGPQRFRLMTSPHVSRGQIQLEVARNDFLVWPALCDGVGSIPLEALTMGTPVIAVDVQPVSDCIRHERNGILTACELEYNWFGAPRASIYAYKAMTEAIAEVAQDNELIDKCRRGTRIDLHQREDRFVTSWTKLLSL